MNCKSKDLYKHITSSELGLIRAIVGIMSNRIEEGLENHLSYVTIKLPSRPHYRASLNTTVCEVGSLYKDYYYYYHYYYYYYYGSTNVWMPSVKNKSFDWAANRNQPQHPLKFVVTITQ